VGERDWVGEREREGEREGDQDTVTDQDTDSFPDVETRGEGVVPLKPGLGVGVSVRLAQLERDCVPVAYGEGERGGDLECEGEAGSVLLTWGEEERVFVTESEPPPPPTFRIVGEG